MSKLRDWVRSTGAEVQKRMPNEIARIEETVAFAATLQSWPIGLGGPDAQQSRIGAVKFGDRWYLSSDPQIISKLRDAECAAQKLKAAIGEACNERGLQIAFTHRVNRIMVPRPHRM